MGKNPYPFPGDESTEGNSEQENVKSFYRAYTLDEIQFLLHKESFVIIDAHFFEGHKAAAKRSFILRRIYRTLKKIVPSLKSYVFVTSRGNFTEKLPILNKLDAFKFRSMHIFNTKWLSNYDSPTLFNRFFTHRWDQDVLKQLPGDISSTRILDIGCGWGRLLRMLADQGAKHLASMDLAPRMVDLVRQRLVERGIYADMVVGDAEEAVPGEMNPLMS